MNIKGFFKEKGYDISEKLAWDKYFCIWEDWYKGKVSKFHSYYVYNGQKRVKREKKSLQSAKKVCEDWADLLFNEKVTISLGSEEDTKAMSDLLTANNAVVLINKGIEKTFALGIGALITSVENMLFDESKNTLDVSDARVNAEFVKGNKIYPLSWNGDTITECAFVTYKTEKSINYVYISMHLIKEDGNYVIQNYKYEIDKSGNMKATDDNNGFLEEFDTKNNIPWFSIIKPNICNNIDTETPFGISIFGNSIDTLKSLDNAYNELDNEIVLGRRRTFISEEIMTYDNGESQLTFDPEDISIYRMPKGFGKDSMIQNSSDELRTDKLEKAVQFQLNILSSKVGFGQERYKFDGANIQTATAVISENSDMFRTIKKHEQVLENSLKTFIKAQAYASSAFSNTKINADKVNIMFDDSVIEDKGAEQIRSQSEVTAGLRSKKNYMETIRGLTDKEIKDEMKQIENEKMSNQEALGIITEEE